MTSPLSTNARASLVLDNGYRVSSMPDHNFAARSTVQHLHGAVEVRIIRAPAAANIEMLLVQVEVRIDPGFAMIGVLPDDDDAACISSKPHGVRNRRSASVHSIVTSAPRP